MIYEIANTVRGFRFRYVSEDQLQEALAAALTSAGFSVEREVRLDSRNRVDLVVMRPAFGERVERIGVEVKIDGSAADVARQCARYLASDEIDGLVLVTSRVGHVKVDEVAGREKPLAIVTLAEAGL